MALRKCRNGISELNECKTGKYLRRCDYYLPIRCALRIQTNGNTNQDSKETVRQVFVLFEREGVEISK